MKFTEEQLQKYAAPLSDSEESRCKNAISMLRDAMKIIGYSDNNKEIDLYEKGTLAYSLRMTKGNIDFTMLVQGSYANNTNVKTHSDVDVAIILNSTFIASYRPGVKREQYGFSAGDFGVEEFKNQVEEALVKKFGRTDIERKDKSIKVNGNSYRVNSDAVPAYRYRDYRNDASFVSNNYIGGIEIRSDSGQTIRNYPEQHIVNGRRKNVDTKHYFKKCVRIIKKMKELMKENGISSADNVSSFALESLLWNVHNEMFYKYTSLKYNFEEVLDFLVDNKRLLSSYKEANGIKELFGSNNHLSHYVQFVDNLESFYEYV